MQFMGYSFDSAWEKFLQILPKYMNSHYYDIMAYCCGLAGFVVAMLLKQRIKGLHERGIREKYGYDLKNPDPKNLKPLFIYRIRNLIIPVLAAIVAECCFEVVAFLSDRIQVHTVWMWIIPFIPIAIYTIYEFFESGLLGWVAALFTIALVFRKNYDYCCEFEDHHKACYAVRVIFVVFGILGILLQLLPSMRTNRVIARKKRALRKESRKSEAMANEVGNSKGVN